MGKAIVAQAPQTTQLCALAVGGEVDGAGQPKWHGDPFSFCLLAHSIVAKIHRDSVEIENRYHCSRGSSSRMQREILCESRLILICGRMAAMNINMTITRRAMAGIQDIAVNLDKLADKAFAHPYLQSPCRLFEKG
jgi:hypothetical protein